MAYSFSQLEGLWRQAGGNPLSGAMAAAVALAESGGNPNATNHNTNGTTDRGLWQINSIHGSLSVFDPLANARAAVQISGNGTTWRPWCTAWSNARCGGTYLGAGAPYQKFLPAGSSTGAVPASSGTPSDGTAVPAITVSNPFDPSSWATAFLRPLAMWAWFGAMGAVGLALLLIGIGLLVWETKAAQVARSVGGSVLTRGFAG